MIETMRREGYELQVGQPQVIYREIDGVKCEPIEELTINVPEEYSSKIIDMVTRRKGDFRYLRIYFTEDAEIQFYLYLRLPHAGSRCYGGYRVGKRRN